MHCLSAGLFAGFRTVYPAIHLQALLLLPEVGQLDLHMEPNQLQVPAWFLLQRNNQLLGLRHLLPHLQRTSRQQLPHLLLRLRFRLNHLHLRGLQHRQPNQDNLILEICQLYKRQHHHQSVNIKKILWQLLHPLRLQIRSKHQQLPLLCNRHHRSCKLLRDFIQGPYSVH